MKTQHRRAAPSMRTRVLVGATAAAAVALAAAALAAAAGLRKQRRRAAGPASSKKRRARAAAAAAPAAMSASGTTAGSVAVVARYSALRSRSAEDEVSILSWNTLSAAFARQNALPWASVTALSWEHRAPLIQAELRATSADIVCLQEVDGSKFEEMQSWLPGYQHLLQDSSNMKADSSGRKDRMVLALFWKPRFQLVWADHRSRTLLAQLRDTSGASAQRDLWVVNVHLEGHPLRPLDRINQLRSALAKLTARLAGTERVDPAAAHVVVCGDFNSGDVDGAAYALLRDGRLPAGATEHNIEVTKADLSHPFALQDAYQASRCPLPFTRKAPGLPATIDFVFSSTNTDVAGVYHPLIGTRPASAAAAAGGGGATGSSRAAPLTMTDQRANSQDQTSKQQLAGEAPSTSSSNSKALAECTGRALAQSLQPRNAGMPNLLCPSDHLPLGVVLRFRPQQQQQAGGDGAAVSPGVVLSPSQAQLLTRADESTPALSTMTGAASDADEPAGEGLPQEQQGGGAEQPAQQQQQQQQQEQQPSPSPLRRRRGQGSSAASLTSRDGADRHESTSDPAAAGSGT